MLHEGVLLPAVEMCICWFHRRRLERRVSTKDLGEVVVHGSDPFRQSSVVWVYSDGFVPVHGYRSQPPLARCPVAEIPKRAPLERQKLAEVKQTIDLLLKET